MLLAYFKPGDWVVVVLGLLLTAWLGMTVWHNGLADSAIIRSGGKTYREVSLARNQIIQVPGPLGTSTIAIHNRQVRVASDPSPHQYCVHQGWLRQAGEIAVYLPNQVSVEMSGSQKLYDSLNY